MSMIIHVTEVETIRATLPNAAVLGNYDISVDVSHFFQPGIEILWLAAISSLWRSSQC